MNKIAIITVLYNSASVLPDFFRSLDRQTCRGFTLYAVDNASPDDSAERAQELASQVSFPVEPIRSETNAGIAAGNNLGIRAALADGCQWIVLANNDTVWEPDALEKLLAGAEQHGASLAVPKITIHGQDRIWYAGGRWNRWRGGTRHDRYGKKDSPDDDISRRTEYAPSCCMLIRGDLFDRVGMMDERFFLYYDDADFVRRAAEIGTELWYIPQSRVSHKESVSTGGVSPLAQYWLSRNLLLFTGKHHSRAYVYYVLCVNLLILFTKRAFLFDRRQWTASRNGLRDGMRLCRADRPHLTVNPLCTD